ncbi:MFS transporter [Amycolatopsis sp. ATCC 39116]|uniref:MFS transporter n=1 Tax=Amycolatopsis sp. (strain ATCC 39116 / 75iv2) TaxID=385957 RepID=UPI001F15EBCF|nr:MFS transporter [Amycolatopsis sp. ATCC 39116]
MIDDLRHHFLRSVFIVRMYIIRLYSKGVDVGSDEAKTRGRALLALSCAAQFMVVLDVSVVNVALPSIQSALGFNAADLPWVFNAYAVVFAGFLLLGGRLADVWGRRRTFLGGLALFTAASLAGGVAGTAGLLTAARAVQGLGAAVLAPATLTVLMAAFPEGARRTRALAVWTAVGIAGGTAGNLLGGALTEFLTWRSTLLINVPVGALALVAAVKLLPADTGRASRPRLDVPGAVAVTVGLGALSYGVSRSADGGGHGLAIAAVGIGITALTAFVLIEWRAAGTPLIPLRLFTSRAILVGNAVMLLTGACLNPMWYFLALSMQNVLHYSAVQTGLGFLPHTLLSIAVGTWLTPWLMRFVRHQLLIVGGALLAAAGFGWQSALTPGSGYLVGIAGPAILIALGSGLLNTPLTTTVTAGIDPADAGAASGLMNTTKQAGAALGLAVLVAATGTTATTPEQLAAAYGHAFLLIAAILTAAAAVAFALPGRARQLASTSSS